jgi:hypothetical protein
MTRPLLLLLAAALSVLSACDRAVAGPLVEVAVVDRDSGQWLPQYPHRGDTWVAGEPGHRYAVRLTNTTGERVLVVLSVDGVNALSGETADPRQGGYVLDPWESAEIAGWRKSLDEVAQFVFTDASDSYATRTGRPRNVGVIGVAVFRERRPLRVMPAPYPPYAEGRMRGESPASAPSTAAADQAMEVQGGSAGHASAQAQRIGTGHGQREWSPIGTTTFVRASSTPAQVEQIRYDEPQRLAALGILPRYPRPARHAPQAFPSGFVPDPPRW